MKAPSAHRRPNQRSPPEYGGLSPPQWRLTPRRPYLHPPPTGDPRRPARTGRRAYPPPPPAGNPGRSARAGRRGLSRLDQRERERERRVSDADASHYGRVRHARPPGHMIPQRKHAKNNSLSDCDPVPLPRSPSKPVEDRPQSQPKPDLMFGPPYRWQTGHRCLYTIVDRLSTPHFRVDSVYGRQPLRAGCQPACP
jgi:hypothetical protein